MSSGSVLLLGLWAAATLAAAGIAQATHVALEAKYASRLHEMSQAWFLAFEGVKVASARLTTPDARTDDPKSDAPKESWGQVPKDPIPFDTGTIRYRIADEQGLIPVNAAPATVLNRLPGFSQPVSDELIGRRNEGALVAHPAELPALSGFRPEAVSELNSVATVYGTGPVNINTASAEVLSKLGFSSLFTGQLLQYRMGLDGFPGTPDDGVFTEVTQSAIEAALKGFFGQAFVMPEEDKKAVNDLSALQPPLLGVKSSFFRVEVEARTAAHGLRKNVTAIVDAGGKIRGWYEK